MILDNLSAHEGAKIRAKAARNKVELCFTLTYGSWANPIEAQFGPLRTFVVAGSNDPNHPALTGHLHRYLHWRNANACHPDVLAAQRRERAHIRSERQRRWGQPPTRTPAWPYRVRREVGESRALRARGENIPMKFDGSIRASREAARR